MACCRSCAGPVCATCSVSHAAWRLTSYPLPLSFFLPSRTRVFHLHRAHAPPTPFPPSASLRPCRGLERKDRGGAGPFLSGAGRFAPSSGSLALHPLLGCPAGLLVALHPLVACDAPRILAQALVVTASPRPPRPRCTGACARPPSAPPPARSPWAPPLRFSPRPPAPRAGGRAPSWRPPSSRRQRQDRPVPRLRDRFEQGGLLGEATLNLAERRRGRGQREYRSTRGCDDTWARSTFLQDLVDLLL
ncbi:hypothetical protein GQ55_7G149200 [Panicum hallii var. hallii]|uniref:Uncharacterized protein n=1 Tax=Panicum hallii var. hallii TaxID=1504633 RepID=A0A2T7CV90_9POAL|nr:hypothetical protein GQ55_7G149200 [Panicum hallii var. hallii]